MQGLCLSLIKHLAHAFDVLAQFCVAQLVKAEPWAVQRQVNVRAGAAVALGAGAVQHRLFYFPKARQHAPDAGNCGPRTARRTS